MQDLKKYFDFSGTISGSTYLLRNIIASAGAFLGGFLIGYGIVDSVGLIMLGMLVLAPACWFSLTNIYKRFNALYPRTAKEYTIGLLFLQILSGFGKGETWGDLISLVLIVIACVLIFKNSNIENHEG
jgi:uncharacterized membrane protein YhaH (DUF805 family)